MSKLNSARSNHTYRRVSYATMQFNVFHIVLESLIVGINQVNLTLFILFVSSIIIGILNIRYGWIIIKNRLKRPIHVRMAGFAILALLVIAIRLILPLVQSTSIPFQLTQFLQISFDQEIEIAYTINSIGIYIILTYIVYLVIASDIQYRQQLLHFSQITLLKIYNYFYKLKKNQGLKYLGSEYPINHLVFKVKKIKTWKYHIIRIPILWSITGIVLAFLVYLSLLYTIPSIPMFSSSFRSFSIQSSSDIGSYVTISNSINELAKIVGLQQLETESGSISDLVIDSNKNVSKLYYISGYEPKITVVDGHSYRILKLIDLNEMPLDLAVNYTIYFNSPPQHLAFNNNTNELYVTTSNRIDVVKNDDVNPLAGLKFQGSLSDIAVDSGTNMVYVATNASLVYAINGDTKEIVSNITIGDYPKDIVVNPTTNKLYISTDKSPTVYIINGTKMMNSSANNERNYNNLVSNVTIGDYPKDIVANPTTNKVYLHEHNSGKVYVMNQTNHQTSEFETGKCPEFFTGSGMDIDFDKNRIYVGSCAFVGVQVRDGDTNNVWLILRYIPVQKISLLINLLTKYILLTMFPKY